MSVLKSAAIAGAVGGGIGIVKGIVDQHAAQKEDPYAGRSAGAYITNGLRDGIGFATLAAGGALLAGHLHDPEAIAKEISGSKLSENSVYKTLVPSKEDLANSIAKNMPDKKETNAAKIGESVHEYLENTDSMLKQMTGDGFKKDVYATVDAFTKAKDFSDEAYQKLTGKLNDSIPDNPDLADAIVGSIKENVKINTKERKTVQADIDSMPWYEKAKQYTKAYYFQDDEPQYARMGATVGGVATVAIAGRYLSGGTLTRDKYGNKDIAGIPFV